MALDSLSRAKLAKNPENPDGFAERLRALMGNGVYTSRSLADASGVSHGTINNWVNGKGRAGTEEVAKVAAVFGWTLQELYYGIGDAGTMLRMAELEAFRRRVVQLARGISGHELIEPAATGLADDEGPEIRGVGSGQ